MFTRTAIAALLLSPMLGACATDLAQRDASEMALYRDHAGEPVRSFHFFGHIDSWTPLGDRAVVVWTRMNEAWLLDLGGACNGLQYTPMIGLTSSAGTVNARFDKVLVRDGSPVNVPCIIQSIRPVDVPALKAAERAARAQPSGT
jgi:hypothetical protein